MASYEDLIAEGNAVPVAGWDFSWFEGRATEERPSWRYQHLMADRLTTASSALDLQTGGGEVLAGALQRVLRPGGSYLSQQVGAGSVHQLTDYMMGDQPIGEERTPAYATELAQAAGLEIVDVRSESLRTEFFDIAAVVHFLRKVIWIVPGFTVEQYADRLRALHEQIQTDGSFVALTERFLIEARKPTADTA
jgi:hypothetical protein